MIISDFARERGQSAQAISGYIARHSEEFDGLITRVGKTVELSDAAVRLLDKAYPFPKPVEILEDTESRRKLIQAQELIIQLQQRLADQAELIADAKYQKMLIEQKDQVIDQQDGRITHQEQEIAEQKKRIDLAKAEAGQLRKEKEQLQLLLEEERAKNEAKEQAGLWARIRRKW